MEKIASNPVTSVAVMVFSALRKEEVPCRTSLSPLASPCFVVRLIGVETEGLLDYQGGGAGIISMVRWNLRAVIFVRCFPLEPFFEINPGILCSGIGS